MTPCVGCEVKTGREISCIEEICLCARKLSLANESDQKTIHMEGPADNRIGNRRRVESLREQLTAGGLIR